MEEKDKNFQNLSLEDYIKNCKGIRKSSKSSSNKVYPSKRLIVDDLSLETNEKDLYVAFSKFGVLTKCKIFKDKFERSMGGAILCYEKVEQAEKALKEGKDLEFSN